MEDLKNVPLEILIAILAIFGGVARYLNGYINGRGFKLSIFISSVIVSGFGGLMFGLLGSSMDLPIVMVSMMSGMGGYFSEQTLKFVYEVVKGKTK
jgi:H+/gluconate symporter-like permease